MRVLVTVVGEGAQPHDVMVDAEESATAADVALALTGAEPFQKGAGGVVTALRAPAAGGGHHLSLWADGQLCDPAAPASAVLSDGMRVSTDDSVGPLLRRGEPVGWYEIRVAGGPASGRVVRLGAGAADIGSGAHCTVQVPDPTLPATALRVRIDVQGEAVLVPAPDTELTVLVDGEEAEGETPWPLGDTVRVGDTLLVLDRAVAPDAHLSRMSEGGLAYNRPPRLNPLRRRSRLIVPQPPTKAERAKFQFIMAFMPMLFGITMWLITKQIFMLLFCLMSPLMMAGQWISDNRDGKKKHRTSMKQYRQDLAAHEELLATTCKQEQRERRAEMPDPAEILLFATGPRRRLWERRLTDPDAMLLRVGTGTLHSDVELALGRGGMWGEEDRPDQPELPDVPVALPFQDLGVVGVAGDRARALSTARWLTVQAAALHSPRDLSVVCLTSHTPSGADWSWLHWLPHTAPAQGQDCMALVAFDSETVARRVNELLGELNRRKAARDNHNALGNLYPDTNVLVVLDGARILRRMPGVPQLLTEGPRFGIYALCLDEDERLLPEECRAVAAWTADSSHHFRLRGHGLEEAGEVLGDQVTADWCELLARSLAPVRDVSRDDADSALPTAARLLNLLEMPDPAGADIERIWRAGGSTTAAPIGIAADGTFVLDIRRDGPHALVAGTTGAGKSELLQTIIASLAVANRPDALNYVLIDYKGGSAFMDLRPAAAHRRHGQRPRRPPHRTRPRLARRRAPPPRGDPLQHRHQGHRGLQRHPQAPARTRTDAPARPGHRRVRLPRRRTPRLHRRPRRHRPPGPLTRRPPDPRHPAPRRCGQRRHPRQHQPADRPARHRRLRVPRRHRGPRLRRHRQVHPGPRLRPLRRPVPGRRPVRPHRWPPPRRRRNRPEGHPHPGALAGVQPPAAPQGRGRGRRDDGHRPGGAGRRGPRRGRTDGLQRAAQSLAATARRADLPRRHGRLPPAPRRPRRRPARPVRPRRPALRAEPPAARPRPGPRRAHHARRRRPLGPLHRAAHPRRLARPLHLPARRARLRHRLRLQRAACR